MLLRKRRIERADVVGRRTRLANKQAVIRLKQAKYIWKKISSLNSMKK